VRAGLVVLQVALSLLLVTGTALMVRSIVRLLGVDPGIEHRQVVFAGVGLPGRHYPLERLTAFYRELPRRVKALPGVEAVGLTSGLPFTTAGGATSFWDADAPEPAPGAKPAADVRVVDPGFFQTLGIPILRGRGIDETDQTGSRRVAVVNRVLAEQVWPGTDPLGHRLYVNWDSDSAVEVVGVVGNVRYWGLQNESRATVYFPSQQQPGNFVHLAVRYGGDPAGLIPQIERELATLDPNPPLLRLAGTATWSRSRSVIGAIPCCCSRYWPASGWSFRQWVSTGCWLISSASEAAKSGCAAPSAQPMSPS
jgi:putative ABC transport system permease protein